MNKSYPQHYSEDMEYYPRPKGRLKRLIEWLVWPCLFLSLYALIFAFSYAAGIKYAISLYPEPLTYVHNIEQTPIQNNEHTLSVASWYDYNLAGEEWSKTHRTAASRDLPRYSYAKVCRHWESKDLAEDYGEKCVIVFINDYGPEEWTGRHIDLSSYAFSKLAPLSSGVIYVTIEPYEAD